MQKKESYTRKEVIAILKRQIAASAQSYNLMGVNMNLMHGFQMAEYLDECGKTSKRLKSVKLVKF